MEGRGFDSPLENFEFALDFDLPELEGPGFEDPSALISLQNSAAPLEICSRSSISEEPQQHTVMNSSPKCSPPFGVSSFLNANNNGDSSSASPLDNRQYGSGKPMGPKKQICRSKVPSRTQSQRHNHILAERQRREEMNEKFSILRTILPRLTKKDKASIVTDTINYVRELERMVRHLQACKSRGTNGLRIVSNRASEHDDDAGGDDDDKEGIIPATCEMKDAEVCAPRVEVQILGSRAIIKVICSRSPGLVLRTHKALDECKVDVLQSNVTTLGSNSVHYFTVQVNPGVSASKDELISALQRATTATA